MAGWAFGVGAAFAECNPRGALCTLWAALRRRRAGSPDSKTVIPPALKELGMKAVFVVHPMGEWCVGGSALGMIRRSFIFQGRGRACCRLARPRPECSGRGSTILFASKDDAHASSTWQRCDHQCRNPRRGCCTEHYSGQGGGLVGYQSERFPIHERVGREDKENCEDPAEMAGCTVEWENF